MGVTCVISEISRAAVVTTNQNANPAVVAVAVIATTAVQLLNKIMLNLPFVTLSINDNMNV